MVGAGARYRVEIRDGDVNFMLCRYAAFEGDALRLGEDVIDAVLGEVEPLLLLQRGLQVFRAPDEARFALLADAATKIRLDRNLAAFVDERFDFCVARFRPSTSEVGKSTNFKSLAPSSIPARFMARLLPKGRYKSIFLWQVFKLSPRVRLDP